jgi:hypothetical protein
MLLYRVSIRRRSIPNEADQFLCNPRFVLIIAVGVDLSLVI